LANSRRDLVTRDITQALREWVAEGFGQIGEIAVRRLASGYYDLRHFDDARRDDLALHTTPEDARILANTDDANRYRRLKTAPTLRHGWRMELANLGTVRRALDFFYPAMLGIRFSHQRGELIPVPFRETLGRQSGMYAVARRITDAQAQVIIRDLCNSCDGCLKTILWQIAPGVPVTSLPAAKSDPLANQLGTPMRALPMLCHEACNLLVTKAREVVKTTAENV